MHNTPNKLDFFKVIFSVGFYIPVLSLMDSCSRSSEHYASAD